MIIYIGLLSSSLSGIFGTGCYAGFLTSCLSLFFGRDEVVHLHVTLFDRLFLQPVLFLALSILLALLSALSFALLLIRIFVVHTVVKVLII